MPKDDKKRREKLERNTRKGDKEVGGIIRRNRRTIAGTVSEFANRRTFATSAALRNALYRELAAEYRKFGSEIDTWIGESVTETARDFWEAAKADMGFRGGFESFSAKHLQNIIGEINPSTVTSLVGINAQAGGMYQSHIRRLRAAVTTTFAEASIEGLTNRQMAERMKAKVGAEAGRFQFIDKGGRNWTADNYFSMLNRTLHAKAARDTYAAAGTGAGFDLYEIAGGITGSSADYPDDPCDQWAGRPFSYTGNTPGFPTYEEVKAAGVFHPNCVHFISALTRSEAARLQESAA